MNAPKAAILIAKARGFTISIREMASEQRVKQPTQEFAEDYNSLRSQVAEAFPELTSHLPPEVSLYRGGGGVRMFPHQSYGEIDTFAEQIQQLLEAVRES